MSRQHKHLNHRLLQVQMKHFYEIAFIFMKYCLYGIKTLSNQSMTNAIFEFFKDSKEIWGRRGVPALNPPLPLQYDVLQQYSNMSLKYN